MTSTARMLRKRWGEPRAPRKVRGGRTKRSTHLRTGQPWWAAVQAELAEARRVRARVGDGDMTIGVKVTRSK